MGSPIRPDLAAPARILSPDEFDQVQGLTPNGVRAAKLPAVAPPFTPRPVAEGTAPQNTVHPARTQTPTTVAGVLGAQMQGMVDNPAQAALGTAATMNPVGGLAAVGLMGKDLIEYAAQKAAEMTLDPASRKLAEADPERISGASAAVQGGMLALFPILHKVGKSMGDIADVSGGMMEAGVRGLDGIPRTADAAATMAKLNGGAAPAQDAPAPAPKSPARLAVDKHVATVSDAFSRMFAPARAVKEQVQKVAAPATVSPEASQAALVIRASSGERAAAYEQDAYKLDEGRRAMNLLPEPDRLGFIDAYEGGDTQPSEEFAPLAASIKAGLDARVDAIRALGTGKLDAVIEHYFPHIWTDASRAALQLAPAEGEGADAGAVAAPASPAPGQSLAETAMQGGQGRMAGKRPFEGSKSFLKKRVIPTTKEGMALGLVPVTTNPVDLALLKMREMDRYLVAHQSLNEMKEQGLVKLVRAGALPPDGYKAIDDKIATVFRSSHGGVTLPDEANIEPSDVTVHGLRIKGQYYAPEPVARVVNNHLSPGLRGNPIFDAYRGLGNTLNQAQLGLSAFHLGMTSIDATVSRVAMGLEHLASGAPLEGAKAIANAPFAALPGIIQGTVGDASNRLLGTDFQWGLGARIRAAYLSPENAPPDMLALANAVKEANGRIRQDSFYTDNVFEKYTSHLRQEWDALKAGDLKGAAAHDYHAGNLAIPSILELTAKPLMEHIVPLQKLQVFGEMAQKVLADLPPEVTLAERRGALASAWDSVDNRMGQLVYDNLFWHRTAKDLAMASVRSVGWNLGTIREIGGGMGDLTGAVWKAAVKGQPAELSHRAAYVTALPITVGMMGAAYQYLRTGEGPQELKDYFYPRTGEVDVDGNPERVQLPSYMKDVAAYSSHPWETIKHKRAPLLSGVFSMLDNEDYYGDQIRNPDDPLTKQAAQEADFIAKQFMPFAVAGAQESTARGDGTTATRAGSFLGITPAPRTAVRSEAQNLMADFLSHRQTSGSTPEDAEARAARANVLAGLRGANGVDLEAAIGDAIEQKQLTPPDLAKLMKRAGMSPAQEKFKRLTTAQAMAVFSKANEREKMLFMDALLSKIQRMGAGAGDAPGVPIDGN